MPKYEWHIPATFLLIGIISGIMAIRSGEGAAFGLVALTCMVLVIGAAIEHQLKLLVAHLAKRSDQSPRIDT
jgi:hypothetical protein